MSLMDFQMDLQETNRQLGRIADMLERFIPTQDSVKVYQSPPPPARKVSPTSPAAQWNQMKQELEQQGRHEEIVAGAYGPRSLKRD